MVQYMRMKEKAHHTLNDKLGDAVQAMWKSKAIGCDSPEKEDMSLNYTYKNAIHYVSPSYVARGLISGHIIALLPTLSQTLLSKTS